MRSASSVLLLVVLAVPSRLAAQTHDTYVSAFAGGLHLQSEVNGVSGWSPAVGGAAGIVLGRGVSVEVGMSTPTSPDFSGTRRGTLYPWGRTGMTPAEILASGAVDVENHARRHVSREFSVLGRLRFGHTVRVQPALLAGATWQAAQSHYSTQAVVGTREQYVLETREYDGSPQSALFLTFGIETSFRITQRLSIAPQARFELSPYADAAPDVILRPGLVARWRF